MKINNRQIDPPLGNTNNTLKNSKKKKVIFIVIPIVIAILLILFLVLFQPWKSKEDKILEKRLKNNPSLGINHEFVESFSLKGTKYEGFSIYLYSWNTKYGRIYARDSLAEGSAHGGKYFYDAYGERLTGCIVSFYSATPISTLCSKFFYTLQRSNADFEFIENPR